MSEQRQRAGQEPERRQYFRIEDAVRLDYRVLSRAEFEQRRHQGRSALAAEEFTAISSLLSISHEMSGVLRKIESEAPDVARYLKALDRKVDLLARSILGKDEDLAEAPARAVNLSASGISFDATEPLAVGSLLELKLLLLPDYIGMLIFGEVVGCDPVVAGKPAGGYCTRVNFTQLREEDQDVLIRHVLQRQSEYLRRRRDQIPMTEDI